MEGLLEWIADIAAAAALTGAVTLMTDLLPVTLCGMHK